MERRIRTLMLMFGMSLFSCAREIPPPVTPGEAAVGAETEGLAAEPAAECALRFPASQLCLTWKWETPPAEGATGSLIFKVFSSALTDLPETPAVVLWMPAMGHGSSPTAVERIGVGTYRCKNVYFVMPGKWQLKFQSRTESVIHDEVIDTITI